MTIYTPSIDEDTLSRLYGVRKVTVLKTVAMISKYADGDCMADVVIKVCNGSGLNRNNYKHLLLIGHIMGVMSTEIFSDKLIQNLNDICQRQN